MCTTDHYWLVRLIFLADSYRTAASSAPCKTARFFQSVVVQPCIRTWLLPLVRSSLFHLFSEREGGYVVVLCAWHFVLAGFFLGRRYEPLPWNPWLCQDFLSTMLVCLPSCKWVRTASLNATIRLYCRQTFVAHSHSYAIPHFVRNTTGLTLASATLFVNFFLTFRPLWMILVSQ